MTFKSIFFFVLVAICMFFMSPQNTYAWVSGSGGTRDTNFDSGLPRFNIAPNLLAIQSDDKLIVAGRFNNTSAIGLNRAVRLNTDGSIDTSFNIGSGFNNDVTGITIDSAGYIYFGGNFTSYNGTPVNRLVKLDTYGNIDNTFNVGSGFNSLVYSIAIASDGKVYVAGNFTSYNGTIRNRIVRLNSDGSFDSTFVIGTAFNSSVSEIKLQTDGRLIVVGNFTNYNGTPINRLLRLNTDGTIDSTFNVGSGVNNTAVDIAIQSDGKIYIVGAFNTYNGVQRNQIARINTNGSLDTTFAIGNYNSANMDSVLIDSNGKILITGGFSYYNPSLFQFFAYAARFNPDGTPDPTFVARPTAYTPSAVIDSNGNIYFAGPNYVANSTLGSFIFKTNSNGNVDNSYLIDSGNGINGVVTAIESDTSGIYLTGQFNAFDGVTQNRIIKLNSLGEKDLSFNVGTGANEVVSVIALGIDSKIIIGGDFTLFDGQSKNRIVRLNTDGSVDNTFNIGTGFNNSVASIAVQSDGKIIVAGAFTTYNGATANRFIRLNTDGSIDTTFPTGTGFNSGSLNVIILSEGKILVGGGFTTYNGTTINRIVRLNTDATIDNTFTIGTGFNSTINRLDTDLQGRIYAVGSFTTYNGVGRNRLIRLNTDGSIDNTFNIGTGLNFSVNSVKVQPDGKVLVGGQFTQYNSVSRIE
jgi:uncharacterized delta-60 repeat protein